MGPLSARRTASSTSEPCVAESSAPPVTPGLTLTRCIELTGLHWGASYRLHGGGVALQAVAGVGNAGGLHDFFGHPELLGAAAAGAAGRAIRLRNAAVDPLAARSVLARAGLSLMLVVPTGRPGHPDGAIVLGAPRVAARWQLGQAGHTQRVSRYCRLLGLLSGLPERSSELLGMAGALHDVGKLNVPSELLLRPGPLTVEERRSVERHAEDGRVMLAGARHPLSELAATIAGTHHERWDGTGYPHGRRGEEIPLAGRIAAIADVYDALTSDRSYRPAMAPQAAVAHMNAGAGTQFDPRLLELFLRALPRMHSVREQVLSSARRHEARTAPPPVPVGV